MTKIRSLLVLLLAGLMLAFGVRLGQPGVDHTFPLSLVVVWQPQDVMLKKGRTVSLLVRKVRFNHVIESGWLMAVRYERTHPWRAKGENSMENMKKGSLV